MITVHHLGVSQSDRIIWLCEELGIPYQLERHERDPVTRLAPPAFKALHPMGLAPVITDGALVLAESGAIIGYLLAKHGQGRLEVPPDDSEFANYLFWFHFANGTLMPSEVTGMIASVLGAKADSPVAQSFRGRSDRAFALIEQRLGESPYLAGQEFTAADLIMFFPLTTMRAYTGRDLGPFPNIRAYLKRVGERPAYQRAMAAGDPGMPLLLG